MVFLFMDQIVIITEQPARQPDSLKGINLIQFRLHFFYERCI